MSPSKPVDPVRKQQNRSWWFLFFLVLMVVFIFGVILLTLLSFFWQLIPTTLFNPLAITIIIGFAASFFALVVLKSGPSQNTEVISGETHGSFDGTLTEADGLPTQFTLRYEHAWQKPIFSSTSRADQSDSAIIDLGNAEVIIDTQSGWTTVIAQKGINLVVNDGDQRTRIHYGL